MNQLPTPQARADGQDPIWLVIRRYLEILRKRIWIVLSILAVGVTATVLYTLHEPKIYEATATVIVNPQAPRVNKDQDVIELGAGSFTYMRDYYNTQLEILTSFPLARATVIQGTPAFYERLAPASTYPGLPEDKRIDKAAEHLQKILTADQHQDSRVIAIKVRSDDPALAEALANAHVDSYIAYMRGKRTSGTGQASEILSVQLDDAEKQLRSAEDAIMKFKTDHDLITQSFDDKQNTVVSELQRYSEALADAKIKRIDLAAIRKQAEALTDDDVLESPIFALTANTDVVNELRDEYVRAKQKFAEVDSVYGPKSAEERAAKSQVDALYAQLQAEATRARREIDEKYQAAVAAEAGYEALVAQRQKDAQELDTLYTEYAPLERDEKFAEDRYTKLAARLGASKEESENDMINVDPHESARDAKKVLPRIGLNIALAAILSLMLGVGLALLLEQMDQTIKGTEGVEALVGSPVLGIIPIVGEPSSDDPETSVGERDLYVFRNSTSQVAECCRSIRTNLMFSAAERKMKTITVSSARPREGKTTTTIYIGTAMAQSGQRVLLVDTDLRRPRLHQSLGVSKERGITSLLLNDASYDDVIKSTEVPNLFVLPSGAIPPNPAELLMTQRFKTILEELACRFDRILLDSPPLLAVTDAVVLARQSEGVLLVARSGQTHLGDVAMATRQLKGVEASILGVVVNTLDISDRRYGYGYYAYRGYGSYEERSKEAT